MSLTELRADIARNQKAALALAASGAVPQPLVDYVNGTIWPWQEALLDELDIIDTAVDDLIEDADDILQAETASQLSVPLVLGAELVAELRKRVELEPATPENQILRTKIATFAKSLAAATDIIAEITVVGDDFEDSDEGAADGEDEDDDEQDDDDSEDK